ncbi:ABC transporter substrate-binding protein [Aromatoleum toluolicum]|uniref:ABC transporter substrate-binding protein n=1 Tax=Aromatoleum toluolicum TaxID=90060 RepID=A0ABX1NL63_9RHOO|nr:ABC transporter substrate-binding protein [Aromatoleum toluolicum]NMG00064.1 ABC transporter substrate-binding protein [Aromatoleum toluolicum]
MFSKTLGALLVALTLLASLVSAPAAAQAPVLIGLDAEFGHKTSTSAQAIQQGIEIAIEEINAAGGVLGGRKLALVVRDNRALPAVGVDNLRELAAMPDLVGVFGGKFSPVFLEWLPVAHQLGVLMLDAWGSADPITENAYRPSYSFRLSLKDAWAAPAMLKFARTERGASRVGILLPNSGWGRSNRNALVTAATSAGVSIVGEHWYNWGDPSLLEQYRSLRAAGAEAIILVANEAEGALLVREVAAQPPTERLPIISHWGVTGGAFAELAGPALDQVDFAVIQTFSFIGVDTPVAKRVLSALKTRYGIDGAERVRAPAGVAHAYDLTHLLARAIARAGSTDRAKVRAAMEKLPPYPGLVRHYERPFTPERHDALGPEQVFMARYTAQDVLVPLARPATGLRGR